MEFEVDFQSAFTNTAKEQDAYNKLMALRMQGNDVDSYIASFNNLVERSGWSLMDRGALEKFKHSLPQRIALRIMYRDTPPTTFTMSRFQGTVARSELKYWIEVLGLLGDT